MKNAILILTALLIFPSCKQNNKSNNTKMSDLTSKNYVERMTNVVKHYPKEPIYQLSIENNWCFSEVLVNDIPVYKNFKEPLSGPTFDINNYIFKSGTQKVTLRLYPIGKYKDQNFTTFPDYTNLSISVGEYDKNIESDTGQDITKYTTPLTTITNEYGNPISKFIATGKTYYEASFTFNATVPYEFDSLSKGQDLRKQDKQSLEKKVVTFYKNQWDLINNKKADDFFSFLELKEKETSQSMYETRTDLEENLEVYLEPFTNASYKLEPLENYKMVFYGDGRIVCLELTSLDGKLRGKSALWGKFERDGLRASFRKYYLYIPEGKNELEILR